MYIKGSFSLTQLLTTF